VVCQVTLRRLNRREKEDVLFSTANFAMFGVPVGRYLLCAARKDLSELLWG